MNTYFEKMRIKHLVKILVDEKYIGTKEYYKMKIKIMEEAMFVFYGSKESVRKQIGMAVPPQGVKIIFEAIA